MFKKNHITEISLKKKVILTPHIGSYALEIRKEMEK